MQPRGRRRRKAKAESYKIYIHKVLKQVHPELGISAKGMAVMNVRARAARSAPRLRLHRRC